MVRHWSRRVGYGPRLLVAWDAGLLSRLRFGGSRASHHRRGREGGDGTQDERFSLAIWDNLLRSGHLRRCSEYQRVCVRSSQAPEHQDLAPSHPADSLILGLRTATTPMARRLPASEPAQSHRNALPRGLPGIAIVWIVPRSRKVGPAQWCARHAPVGRHMSAFHRGTTPTE